uniref:VGCC_beta4Aa_N domain-containing protein n=1 Tax=Heterorhabditis bacteriophora TaxID=37862 RepID=A0A1I7XP20_HETBA
MTYITINSHHDDDLDLEAGNRETLRRDAERQAALQLERAKSFSTII